MHLKTIIFLLVFQITASAAFSQLPTCKSLQVGSFKIESAEFGTTYITRTKTAQTEINNDYGIEMIFDIRWIDSCTYELRPKKLIRGPKELMGDGKLYIISRITDITENGYTALTSDNMNNEPMKFKVEIVRLGNPI